MRLQSFLEESIIHIFHEVVHRQSSMPLNNNYGISILIYIDLRIKDILIVAKQQDDQVVVKLQFSDED